MSSKEALWERIRKVAEEAGVELFDIDAPSESGGSLRVYITKPHGVATALPPVAQEGEDDEGAGSRRTGVSLDECASVSKQLLDIDEQEGLIPEGCLLEVSSPGINRRLRRPEHFVGAVGERVRVKFRADAGTNKVVTGTLKSAQGAQIEVVGEDKQGDVTIRLDDIKEARVDFQF